MNHRFRRRLVRPLVWWLTVGLLSSLATAQVQVVSGQDVESSEPTATSRPTPTPTPSPADLEMADSFVELGKFDDAAGAYAAVIQRGTLGERLQARYSLAKLLLDEGKNELASQQLDAFLIEAPGNVDVRDAQLLLAEALSAEARFADALSLFDAYLQGGGAASPYVAMDRAEALAWLGATGASSAGESALENDIPRSTRIQFIKAMAQALQESQPEDAVRWYERLEDESSHSADDALAIWRTALIQRDLGDGAAWFNAWPTIIKNYPDTPAAQEAIEDIPPYKIIGEIVDPFYTALVHYQAGDSRAARADFLDSLSANRNAGDPALAARSSFYLAVLDERAGKYSSAIRRYAAVVQLDATVDLADDALWWEGRLYELQGQPDSARDVYEQLLAQHRGSVHGKEARFRLGLLLFDQREWLEAAGAFSEIAQSSRGEEKQRALLWQGKAFDAAGDDEAADEVWRSLVDVAAEDYYGLRAAVLLGKGEGKLRDASIDGEARPDWAAIETWLSDVGAGDPAAAQQAFAASEHWNAGVTLLALGMEHRASAELDSVLESSLGDPNMLFILSREFSGIGQHGLASRAAARLLAHLPESARATAPDDVWKLAYPAPYAAAFDDAADESNVPNVLLLALVRQESFFGPLAGSQAGAIGLTQVVAPTAEEIAAALDITDFETDDLYRPEISLRFGAHYLAGQLDSLDNFYEALAAYNGGPGNAQRWAEVANGDIDRFMAEVEYSQTETYIRLVSENLARYRQLYQGFDEPTLPKD